MTLYQAKFYTMKADGADGVEGFHKMNSTDSPMRSHKNKMRPIIDKAVKNLMEGKRWDSRRPDGE